MVLVYAFWGHHMSLFLKTYDASSKRSLRARQYMTKVARQKPDHPLGKGSREHVVMYNCRIRLMPFTDRRFIGPLACSNVHITL